MSTFTEDVKGDLKKNRMMLAMGCFLGAFLCIYMNNIAVAAGSSAMGAQMGTMYVTMYNKVMCVMPLLMVCTMGIITLAIKPRMAGMKEEGTAASHITAIGISLVAVEVVILICHLCVILLRNGSIDGYAYVPVAYVGNIAIGLSFAGVGLLLSRFVKPRIAMGVTMLFAVWTMFAGIFGILGLDAMVALGAGAEWLSNLYYFTVTGFVDIDSLITIGTADPDYTCLLYYLALYIIDFVLIGLAIWKDRKDAKDAEETAIAA